MSSFVCSSIVHSFAFHVLTFSAILFVLLTNRFHVLQTFPFHSLFGVQAAVFRVWISHFAVPKSFPTLVFLSGGRPTGRQCGPLHFHGFQGVVVGK